MRAAIYARKSTDQNVSDEAKSVARQIQHGRTFAVGNGWIVDEGSIYVDDGVSGAEFANRPGYMRLMAALTPRARVDVLIMSESSRLGREAWETGYALKQILQAGVRVFFYLEGRECSFEHPMDKLMFSMVQAFDEMERSRASQRSADKARQLALSGHVTGGRLFGYDNIRVGDHTERRINETEATCIRHIFDLCAEGRGQSAICKLLNAAGAPSPRPQHGRPKAWAPSSVREVLFRETYRGVLVWNRTRKRDTWGQVRQADRQQDEWLTVPTPQLRIVTDEQWASAHARLDVSRAGYLITTGGHRHGRPSHDVDSKYLLTGLARCGHCGGSMYIKKQKVGKVRIHVYGCTSYHRRGSSVCKNSLEVPMALADRAITDALLRDVVNPAVLQRIVDRALVKAQPRDTSADLARLTEQVRGLEREIDRLVSAIAVAGDVPALAEAIRNRQAEREARKVELASLQRPAVDMTSLHRALLARVEEWRALLPQQKQGRVILRKLLAGSPIVMTPTRADRRTGYEFVIEVPMGNFLQQSTVPGGDATIVATLKTHGFIELPRRRAA